MKKTYQLFLLGYYFLWIICLLLAYAYLTEKYYSVARWFGPIIGILTIGLSSLTLLVLFILYIIKKTRRASIAKFIKFTLIPFLGLIPFFIINSIPNQLDSSISKVKVTYVAYGCECANWRLIESNGYESKEQHCEDIFLEASDSKKEIPEQAFLNGRTLELTGKFYKRKGFPKDYPQSEQQPEKARIFQYKTYKLIGN